MQPSESRCLAATVSCWRCSTAEGWFAAISSHYFVAQILHLYTHSTSSRGVARYRSDYGVGRATEKMLRRSVSMTWYRPDSSDALRLKP